jgi:hypothetical protein
MAGREVPDDIAPGALDGDAEMALARAQAHSLAVFSRAELEHFAAVMANNTRFMAGMDFDVFDGDIYFVVGDDRPPASITRACVRSLGVLIHGASAHACRTFHA